MESNLNNIFTTSDAYNPNLVACILEIGLKQARIFRLNGNAISIACQNSLQQPLGIILIEEYLAINENDSDTGGQIIAEQQTKRIKLDKDLMSVDDDESSTLWIELAKLYRSMNNYDCLKGIFSHKKTIVTDSTKTGFYHESNNDYYSAKKCYSEAMKLMSNGTSKVEKELWEESFLRCCNELTDWKAMCEYTTSTATLKNLFADSYSVQVLFPWAFKSKLKLILQEDVSEQKKHQDLIEFIDGLDPDGKKYLEQVFCLEMAIVNLHQKDFDASKYYANIAIQKFLMVIFLIFVLFH